MRVTEQGKRKKERADTVCTFDKSTKHQWIFKICLFKSVDCQFATFAEILIFIFNGDQNGYSLEHCVQENSLLWDLQSNLFSSSIIYNRKKKELGNKAVHKITTNN